MAAARRVVGKAEGAAALCCSSRPICNAVFIQHIVSIFIRFFDFRRQNGGCNVFILLN